MNFVLVHGAWHGGWCWRRVADRLVARGHRVFTPTLTGVGERSHLLAPGVNLSTHILDIANLIRWEELSDVVLCGHSYAGMVVTGAADQVSERIRTLVYLDAFVPESGQSMQDIRPRDLPEGLGIPPTSAETFQVNTRDRTWVDRLCTPQPVESYQERISLTGAYRAIQRRVYIRAGGYPAPVFDQFYQRFKADAGWTTHLVPCGHDVMIDMPDALAELLEAQV